MSVLRSAGLTFNQDDYPSLEKFNVEHLPNWHEVLRRLCTCVKSHGIKQSLTLVAKEVESLWIKSTVYCIGYRHIHSKIKDKYDRFIHHRNSFNSGKPTIKSIISIKEM